METEEGGFTNIQILEYCPALKPAFNNWVTVNLRRFLGVNTLVSVYTQNVKYWVRQNSVNRTYGLILVFYFTIKTITS